MTEANENIPAELLPPKRRVVLLTGMSGAGLSTALKALEDIGYEAVDNLRLALIPALLADTDGGEEAWNALAVVVDTRNATFAPADLLRMVRDLKALDDLETQLVFLDCADDTLQRRFTETRRRHPLANDCPVSEGIRQEREILAPVREAADLVLDTSLLSLHDLRRWIGGNLRLDDAQTLSLFVMSFSFRQGVPREADLVFDVRFLNNPYWDPSLRHLSGQDEAVANYIERDPDTAPFLERLSALLLPLLPRYLREGKSYLTIAIGCTGGRHRSVYAAEKLTTILAANGYVVGIAHRDKDRAEHKG